MFMYVKFSKLKFAHFFITKHMLLKVNYESKELCLLVIVEQGMLFSLFNFGDRFFEIFHYDVNQSNS